MVKINFDEGRPIRGDILKKAFNKFDYLGETTKEVLIEDLELQGIMLDDKHHYRLGEIENYFNSLFGRDVTPLLIVRLKKILSDLKWSAIGMLPILQFSSLCIAMRCICLFCNCHNMISAGMSTA